MIDKQTGIDPDLWAIATQEGWASNLLACDMEGFALMENGTLILLDECGNYVFCPDDRFDAIRIES